RERPLRVRREAVGAETALRKARQLVSEPDGRGERLAARHEPVHEPHPHRLLARHAAPGEDHMQCMALADEPREPDRAEVDQRHAPATTEDAEDRIARGDAEIAPEGELETP